MVDTIKPDRIPRAACPSCGCGIFELPAVCETQAAIFRPWRLVDRSTVIAYASSLSTELNEWLLAFFVDKDLQLLSVETIGRGSSVEVKVDMRRLFTRALQIEAEGIVLVHNHPSGDSRPSKSDEMVTDRMRSLAQTLGIPLLGHFVIGDEHFSIVA